MIYLWKHKYETFANFQLYKEHVENQTNKRIKILRSNHGGIINLMNLWISFQMHGIKKKNTIANTPQQNGVAERKNRSLGCS
jgi:hypothetical protein